MSTPFAVQTFDVSRTYKVKSAWGQGAPTIVKALDGVSLTVEEGELFGLLGPNGAGKTTLIKILVTLLLPSSGRALVDGLDVATQANQVRQRIGMVSGGESSGYGILTVREQLWMFSQFHGLPGKEARRRIDELLGVMGMAEDADKKVYNLSTGMRQKMNLCRGLVSDPKILFLDEPTLGLDVGIARDVRAYVKKWVAERPHKTVLLTTHYMQEADELCDRVAIIDRGKVIACDTPEGLKRRVQEEVVYRLRAAALPDDLSALGRLPAVTHFGAQRHDGEAELTLTLADEGALSEVIATIAGLGGRLLALEARKPTLEDTFISLVGRGLNEGAAE